MTISTRWVEMGAETPRFTDVQCRALAQNSFVTLGKSLPFSKMFHLHFRGGNEDLDVKVVYEL